MEIGQEFSAFICSVICSQIWCAASLQKTVITAKAAYVNDMNSIVVSNQLQ